MKCDMCHPEVQEKWCDKCMPVPKRYRSLFPFPAFNPIQTEAYRLLKANSRANLLVLSLTNTGKTAVAELAIQRRIEKERKGKVLILEPLKALAREKVERLKKIYPLFDIIEMTSDVDLGSGHKRNKNLLEADVIVCSYEMLDVMSRKMEIYSVLNRINLLIVDEVHELGDISRGADLDGSITRFLIYKKENSQRIQFIGLSATFDNSDNLKSYVEQFVKKVHVLTSDFSPIKVHVDKHIYTYPKFQRIPALMRVIPEYLNKKGELLVMFLSVGDTYKLTNKLNAEIEDGIAKFHNAQMAKEQRIKVDEEFRNREFKILVCTPTMLAGVSLPCQSIILDISYFNPETFSKSVLPIQKIKQAAGRVGRLPYYKEGYVKYICDWEVAKIAQAELLKPNICKGTIINKLDDVLNVEINMQTQDRNDLMIWYKKTFSSRSSDLDEKNLLEVFDATLNWLEAHRYIQIIGKRLIGTGKGEMAVKSKVRPMFLEHALKVFKEYKMDSKIITDQDILTLTEKLFSVSISDVVMNEKKLDAIKEAMEYVWIRTRRNSRKIDWHRNNDYAWISNISMSIRQLSYPLNMLMSGKKKKLLLKYLNICFQKGIIPVDMIKLSRLLTKNHIQRVGNKRLLLLQLNGFTWENLKDGKVPRAFKLPVETDSLRPLGYSDNSDISRWEDRGYQYSIMPTSTIKRIRKMFRR